MKGLLTGGDPARVERVDADAEFCLVAGHLPGHGMQRFGTPDSS